MMHGTTRVSRRCRAAEHRDHFCVVDEAACRLLHRPLMSTPTHGSTRLPPSIGLSVGVAALLLLGSGCSLLSGLSELDVESPDSDSGTFGAPGAKSAAGTADDGGYASDARTPRQDASPDAGKLPVGAECRTADECADGACVRLLPLDLATRCLARCPADPAQCPNHGRGCDKGYCRLF